MLTLLRSLVRTITSLVVHSQAARLSTTFLLLAAVCLLPTGPNAHGQNENTGGKVILPGSDAEGGSSLLLTVGDLLDVEVFNTPELSGRVRVDQNGSVAMPVVGDVKVASLTPSQAAAAIEQRLRDDQLMFTPSVTVLVTDYATQGIDVLGEVRNPGIYRFLGTHSLYDALTAAGGTTPAEGSIITITHHSDPLNPTIIHVQSPDYSTTQRMTQVKPGDIVDVSRAETIYVVGDVSHSGQFPLSYGKPLNVLDALALAQGANKTAKLGNVSIVRKTADGGAQAIPVDLRAIEKNNAADPVLQADDIVVIPRSGVRAFLDTAIPGAAGTVVGALAYGLINR